MGFARAGFVTTGIDLDLEGDAIRRETSCILMCRRGTGTLVAQGQLHATSDFSVVASLDTHQHLDAAPQTRIPTVLYRLGGGGDRRAPARDCGVSDRRHVGTTGSSSSRAGATGSSSVDPFCFSLERVGRIPSSTPQCAQGCRQDDRIDGGVRSLFSRHRASFLSSTRENGEALGHVPGRDIGLVNKS